MLVSRTREFSYLYFSGCTLRGADGLHRWPMCGEQSREVEVGGSVERLESGSGPEDVREVAEALLGT